MREISRKITTHEELVYRLNNIRFIGLKDIHVGNVLCLPSWNFAQWGKSKRRVLTHNKFKSNRSTTQTAFFYSNHYSSRVEHYERFLKVARTIDNPRIIVETNEAIVNKMTLDRVLIVLWCFQMMLLNIPFSTRWFLSCRLYEYFYSARCLIKKLTADKIKRIVVFGDAAPLENMLVQLCKKRNMSTFTLQHGIINGAYGYAEFKVSESDTFLAWGRYTYDMAAKFMEASRKVEIVGNICLPERLSSWYMNGRSRNFLVCLGGNINKSEWKNNVEILKLAETIADKFGLKYIIRFHPNDNKNAYKDILNYENLSPIDGNGERLSKLFESVSFVLCGNSTVFIEGLYYKVPSFRFIGKAMENIDVCRGIQWGKVDSWESFEKLYEQIGSEKYARTAERILKYMFEDVDCVNEYRRVILGEE